MDQNQRVSIIMGIYNCAATLPEALDSLLAQTFSGWKVIMCDDGSKDDTYEVARTYSEQYPEKFILIKNDRNMGLNCTLNHCLEYADTEYIARMDGDDISLPTRLEKEVAFLDAHPEYAIVSCPMIYFDDQGDFMTGRDQGEPSLTLYASSTPFCHAPCMVRREAFQAVNGYTVAENRLRVEDRDLWLRMRIAGYRGYNLSEPLYKMRDDRNAYRRRKMKYRVNEARVSMAAIRELKLPVWNYIYVLRPILVGLLPGKLYNYLHKKNMQ